MSLLSQFFPSGGGSKMDVDVLILSGGGGGAISSGLALCGPQNCQGRQSSGSGGGGAVFRGTIPIEPGSTVPIVVGGGGAGFSNEPIDACFPGSIGGCSKITYPEGTVCVMGGGGGAHARELIGTEPNIPSVPTSTYGNYTAGTGGSGGCRCRSDCTALCGGQTPTDQNIRCMPIGGKSVYGTGRFKRKAEFSKYDGGVCCVASSSNWEGVDIMNHKYGQFSGGAAAGGWVFIYPGTPCTTVCMYNSLGSGGAGGPGLVETITCEMGAISIAGKGVCSDISGTREEYGRGVVPYGNCQAVFPGRANYGEGGHATCCTCGSYCSANGGSGTVIVRYPTQFAAAPSSPGATDCSPQTPGYYTYRFNSSGSITLP